MSTTEMGIPIEILLVEDNLGDVRLTRELLRRSRIHNNLSVVTNGEKAIAFLRQEGVYASVPRPDLVLLDLNLPKVSGHQVLEAVKADDDLRRIPIVVLTTSQSEEDIMAAYDLRAISYITKPMTFDQFMKVIRGIETFGLTIVKQPAP
jgi:two-component system, chemotaxis family, response regulator Rcp1